jgi:transcriptional regulator with XRE-family HTH domain
MTQSRVEFGRRLREERERIGLTQAEFAVLAGVKRVAQYLYERGERAPTIDYLHLAAEGGVDIVYLLSGSRLQGRRPKTFQGLTPEQVSQLYAGVETLAVDRHGRPLPFPVRQRFMEAACQIIFTGEMPEEGKLQWRLEKLATVFK